MANIFQCSTGASLPSGLWPFRCRSLGVLVESLGADFGVDFGRGFSVRILGADFWRGFLRGFLTGCVGFARIFAAGAKPQGVRILHRFFAASAKPQTRAL